MHCFNLYKKASRQNCGRLS